MNAKYLWVIIALWGLSRSPLQASNGYWSVTQSASVEIVPLNVSLQNDSVTLHLRITVSDIHVGSNYSHVLIPIFVNGNNSLTLPRVYISGRKRASYLTRERALDPFQRKPYSISIYRRGRAVPPIYYSVSFPYSSWMNDCEFHLRQVSEGSSKSTLLVDERLCDHFLQSWNISAGEGIRLAPIAPALVSAPAVATAVPLRESPVKVDTVMKADTPAPVSRSSATLFMSYPAEFSGVDALFCDNASELGKVDRLLLPILNHPGGYTCSLLVTGYCSPDGVYADNERLARKRTQDFVRYLRSAYPLPARLIIRTSWVAEDWQGLVEALRELDIPYRDQALTIIETLGIFEGRERELMKLDEGRLYRYLKRAVFPKLRRISLSLEYNGGERTIREDY